MRKYLFLGGDRRQQYAAQYLTERGNSVRFAESSPDLERLVSLADSVVLPLPVSRDGVTVNSPLSVSPVGLDRVIAALVEGQTVFAGMPGAQVSSRILSKGVKLYDYYADEALVQANSVSTAEGVIYEIIGATDHDICSSKIAVTGYGRTASALSRRLRALGAEVTAAARSARDRECAVADGCKAIQLHELIEVAPQLDLLVNTVPAPLVGREIIKKLKKSCLLIEIASKPYGIDLEAAEQLEIKAIVLPSLPGKISPKSAGEAIAKTIINLEQTEGSVIN